MEEVAEYLERTLCAQCKGHITKVIVSPVKDFSLIYNFRKGQLTVSYNYGEWNSFGFPQHMQLSALNTMVRYTFIRK